MAESSPNGKKTLQEKEKLLVKGNFSFSHSVFKRLVLQSRKNQGLFGKGLKSLKVGIVWLRPNALKNNHRFSRLWKSSLLKHFGKGGNVSIKSAFSPFPTILSALSQTNSAFLAIFDFVICSCFQFATG